MLSHAVYGKVTWHNNWIWFMAHTVSPTICCESLGRSITRTHTTTRPCLANMCNVQQLGCSDTRQPEYSNSSDFRGLVKVSCSAQHTVWWRILAAWVICDRHFLTAIAKPTSSCQIWYRSHFRPIVVHMHGQASTKQILLYTVFANNKLELCKRHNRSDYGPIVDASALVVCAKLRNHQASHINTIDGKAEINSNAELTATKHSHN